MAPFRGYLLALKPLDTGFYPDFFLSVHTKRRYIVLVQTGAGWEVHYRTNDLTRALRASARINDGGYQAAGVLDTLWAQWA